MMLASGVAPVVDMRRANVALGLGTDGPAGSNNNLDMVEEAASAARLQKITRGDPKALSARDVLEMATLGGARALGMAIPADRLGAACGGPGPKRGGRFRRFLFPIHLSGSYLIRWGWSASASVSAFLCPIWGSGRFGRAREGHS